MNEILKVNLFGRDLQFEKDYSSRYNSCSSFLLTIIVVISTIVVSFLFGQEIYLRKNPKSSQSIKIVNDEDTSVILDDFPIIFSFSNALGQNILDSDLRKILRISPVEIIYDKENITRVVHSFSICDINSFVNNDQKHFVKEVIESGKLNNETFYCFNNTNIRPSFKGKRSNPISNMLYLNLQRCRENCRSDFKSIIEGMYFKYVYVNSFVDPKNYTNPIKYFAEPQLIKISDTISKDIIHSFTRNILQTNEGWILDNIKEKLFVSSKNSITEFFFSTTTLMTLYFESPNNVNTIFREYMKIQDLLANIGGFFNASVILINVFFSHYLRFDYYMFIDSKIYSSKTTNKPKEEILNNQLSNILRNNYVNSNIRNQERGENVNLEKNVENENNPENQNEVELNKNKNISVKKSVFKEEKDDDRNSRKEIKKIRKIKDEVKRDENDVGNNSKQRILNNKLEDKFENYKINHLKDKDPSLESMNNEIYTEYYLSYLYHNICCCDPINEKRINRVQQVISFENYIEKSLNSL